MFVPIVYFILIDINKFANNMWREFITKAENPNLWSYFPVYLFPDFQVKNYSSGI